MFLRVKTCGTCKESKALDSFNRKQRSSDGFQPTCRVCNQARARLYYKENREHHIRVCVARRKQGVASLRAKYLEFLSNKVCEWCGEDDIRVLEADHLDPATKRDDISGLIHTPVAWKTIEEELRKCRILCSNCHARRTHEQNDSYRHSYWVRSSAVEQPTFNRTVESSILSGPTKKIIPT